MADGGADDEAIDWKARALEAMARVGDVARHEEEEQERISNLMMARIQELILEKQRLAQELEEEEECMTNALQHQVQALRREKMQLAEILEEEEERLVNRIQKQLEESQAREEHLRKENAALRRRIEELTHKAK